MSPSDRQSKIVMTRIQGVVDSNPEMYEHVTRKNASELWLDNKSAIISLPNNPDRLRGFSATDIYPDVKAYDLYPSTISPLISEDDLERERLNLAGLEFKQEYQGEFLEEVDVYYPLDLITPCVDPTLQLKDMGEPGKTYVMGLDFAKQHDETVLVLLERDVDRKLTVRHISAWSHMDYSDQIGRIHELAKRFQGGCRSDRCRPSGDLRLETRHPEHGRRGLQRRNEN